MSSSMWLPLPPAEVLVELFRHQYMLENAIDNIEATYAKLCARYVALHPAVGSNHLVPFRHRMCCGFAFTDGASGYAPRTINHLKLDLELAAASLAYGFIDNAKWALSLADAEMEGIEPYLEQLNEALNAHESVDVWLKARGLLGVDDRVGPDLTAYQAQQIVQPDRIVRGFRMGIINVMSRQRLERGNNSAP